MKVNLIYSPWNTKSTESTLILVPKTLLTLATVEPFFNAEQCKLDRSCLSSVIENLPANEVASFYYQEAGKGSKQIAFAATPCDASRNNCPARPDAITEIIQRNITKKGEVSLLIIVENQEFAFAAGCAVARCFPLYCRKTSKDCPLKTGERNIFVTVHCMSGQHGVSDERFQHAADGIRLAGRLTDMPTMELNCNSYVDEIVQIANHLPGVSTTVMRGEELRDKGFGGIWHVGKASSNAPALVVLSYQPIRSTDEKNAIKTLAMVGKGITYDTGGLSIKDGTGMVGMKRDMGGSASILGAFQAAVLGKYPNNLHAVLCIAENAVNEKALRPDDIIELYSGKTVEINNPDAEGRLVLGDGVAFATKHLNPDVIIDMATLTGAQAIITGKRHGAVLCNNAQFEQAVVKAGINSGDLVYPILYCPEFLRKEFKSELADMKNSVKDRKNAQSSCAGHFIEDHLEENYKGIWCHLDIAEPISRDERATGFGVALLLELLNKK